MVEVLCDTSFLIHLATNKIKNISNLETDIGQINFVVPEVVMNELEKLKNNINKKQLVLATLDYIKNFKIIPISGKFADKSIINHVRDHGGIVGTLDKELKKKYQDFRWFNNFIFK